MTFRTDLFEGKVALVTGGTQGIGAAIAAAIAGLGAHVVAAGLPPENAPPEPPGVTTARLDVTVQQDVEALVATIPRLDILVNCAGIIQRGDEHRLDVFERVLAVNLTGTMRLCAAARPLLAAQRGSIVNLASMLSYVGGGLVPAYSASKGGIAQLTKSLAIAYALDGIRVNAVSPGWISTPLTQALQNDAARSDAILKRTPLARWGRPEDVAQAVMFLCAPAASFITGTILPVDGGYLAA